MVAAALCSDSLLFAGSASSPEAGAAVGAAAPVPSVLGCAPVVVASSARSTFSLITSKSGSAGVTSGGTSCNDEIGRSLASTASSISSGSCSCGISVRTTDVEAAARSVKLRRTVAGSASFSIAQHAALPTHPSVVGRIAARSRVPESFVTVEPAQAGRQDSAGLTDRHALGDPDRDPAERVDQTTEAGKIDDYVVVHRQSQRAFDSVFDGGQPRSGRPRNKSGCASP